MLESCRWLTEAKNIGTWTLYLHSMFEINIISDSGTNWFWNNGKKCLQVRSYTEARSFRRLCQRSQSTCRLTWKTPAPVEKGSKNMFISVFIQCFSKFYKQISLINNKNTITNSWCYFIQHVPWPWWWDSACFKFINNVLNVFRCEVLLETGWKEEKWGERICLVLDYKDPDSFSHPSTCMSAL